MQYRNRDKCTNSLALFIDRECFRWITEDKFLLVYKESTGIFDLLDLGAFFLKKF